MLVEVTNRTVLRVEKNEGYAVKQFKFWPGFFQRDKKDYGKPYGPWYGSTDFNVHPDFSSVTCTPGSTFGSGKFEAGRVTSSCPLLSCIILLNHTD